MPLTSCTWASPTPLTPPALKSEIGSEPDLSLSELDLGLSEPDLGRSEPDLGLTEPDLGLSQPDLGLLPLPP